MKRYLLLGLLGLLMFQPGIARRSLDKNSKSYHLEREVSVKRIDWMLLNIRLDLSSDNLTSFFVLDDLYYRGGNVHCIYRILDFSFFSLTEAQKRRQVAERILLTMAKLRFFLPQLESSNFTFDFVVTYTPSDFFNTYVLNIKGRKVYATLNTIASYADNRLDLLPENFPRMRGQNDPKVTLEDWKSYQLKELFLSTIPKTRDDFSIASVQYGERNDNHTVEVVIEAKNDAYGQDKVFRRNKRPWQKEKMEEIAGVVKELSIAVIPEIGKDANRLRLSFRLSDKLEDYAEFKDGKITIF